MWDSVSIEWHLIAKSQFTCAQCGLSWIVNSFRMFKRAFRALKNVSVSTKTGEKLEYDEDKQNGMRERERGHYIYVYTITICPLFVYVDTRSAFAATYDYDPLTQKCIICLSSFIPCHSCFVVVVLLCITSSVSNTKTIRAFCNSGIYAWIWCHIQIRDGLLHRRWWSHHILRANAKTFSCPQKQVQNPGSVSYRECFLYGELTYQWPYKHERIHKCTQNVLASRG